MWVSWPDIPLRESYDTGMVIMTHDRPQFVRKLFSSLAASHLENVIIIVFDDASSNPETLRLVEEYFISGIPVIKFFKPQHEHFNIHENLRFSWDFLSEKYACQHLAVIDSDMVVKPNWLEKIRELHKLHKERYPAAIISGFDACISHPRQKTYPHYKVKSSIGGANMFFDTAMYHEFIRSCLQPYWDDQVVAECQKRAYPFLVTRPSVMQHEGVSGLHGTGYWRHDYALNYSLASSITKMPAFICQKTISTLRHYYRKYISRRHCQHL